MTQLSHCCKAVSLWCARHSASQMHSSRGGLQQSRTPVVRDSWLSACVAAQARAPFAKHQLPATRLAPPAAAVGSHSSRGHKRALAEAETQTGAFGDTGLSPEQQQHAKLPLPKRQHTQAAAPQAALPPADRGGTAANSQSALL
jgi:hypothetical protein